MTRRRLYMLIDGANIDGALSQILKHKPQSDERPRWDKVLEFSRAFFVPEDGKAIFFIAVDPGPMPRSVVSFIYLLTEIGIETVKLFREEGRQVVDEAILKVLQGLIERKAEVLLLSHDGGYASALQDIRRADPDRRIAVLGFPEYLSSKFNEVEDLQVYDLEKDADAFTYELPRDLPSSIDDWNPDYLLD